MHCLYNYNFQYSTFEQKKRQKRKCDFHISLHIPPVLAEMAALNLFVRFLSMAARDSYIISGRYYSQRKNCNLNIELILSYIIITRRKGNQINFRCLVLFLENAHLLRSSQAVGPFLPLRQSSPLIHAAQFDK